MDAYTPALPPEFKLHKRSEKEPKDGTREKDGIRTGPIGSSIPSGFKDTDLGTEDSDSSSSSSFSSSSDDEANHEHKHRLSDSKDDHQKDSQHTTLQNIGPALPPGFVQGSSSSDVTGSASHDIEEDDLCVIGPVLHKGPQIEMSAAEQIEMRAQRMKDKLLKKDTEDEGPVKREEWMLSLPEKMKKKVGIHVEAKSSFSRSKCTAERDETWTETPAQRERREQPREKEAHPGPAISIISSQKEDVCEQLRQVFYINYKTNQEERDGVRPPRKRRAEDDGPSTRDLQMNDEIEQHNKKHKREKSLLEIHQAKMDKKKKKEKKKAKKKEKKARKKAKKEGREFKEKRPERVPFDRERDLQANVFDDAMKRSAMKKSAGMSSRFGGGAAKYL